MSRERATVLVADDHPLFRRGMTGAVSLRSDLELIGEASNGRAALDEIVRLGPAVALLDIKMPGLDGLQVLRAIHRDCLPTAVVLISAFISADLVYRCIAGGASAILNKDADRDQICDSVAAAARGEVRLPPEIQGQLIDQVRLRAENARPTLTPREGQVLGLIAEGLSAPDIARRLTLSTPTIKSHLQSLYEKLGVNERAAAVAAAMRTGLLE